MFSLGEEVRKERKKIMKYKQLEYVIQFPENYREGERYPLIFYIHGAGGRGTDLSIIENYQILKVLKEQKDERFIAVLPQCYADTWFDIFEQLQDFVKHMVAQDFTDPNRVYLTGSSMGAYASWQLAMTMNDTFAALLPVCGGGMYWNADRIKDLPIWAFHGALDPVVLPEESIHMVAAVNRCGGNAKLTVLPNVEHNAWDFVYPDAKVYDWLLSHVKEKENHERSRTSKVN